MNSELPDLIDLSGAPDTPIRRLMWLSGLSKRLDGEVERAWRRAYFEARIQGALTDAIALKLHSRKRIMRWIRNENESRGRAVRRWGDGF